MEHAFLYDVPADVKTYNEVRRLIGDETPPGLIAHVVVKHQGALRHIEVWDNETDWQRFHDERVEPAVHHVLRAAGFKELPPDPPVEPLDLVDVWIGH